MMRFGELAVLHVVFLAVSLAAAAVAMAGRLWMQEMIAWFSDRASRRYVRRLIDLPQEPSPPQKLREPAIPTGSKKTPNTTRSLTGPSRPGRRRQPFSFQAQLN